MDIEKYLQNKIEEQAEAELSEEDREYIKTLAAATPVQSKKLKPKWIAFLSCAATVVVAAVITMSVIFAPNNSKIKYSEENEASVPYNLTELNNELKYFKVELEDVPNDPDLSKSYDAISKDVLYYKVILNDFFENSQIKFIVNKNYVDPNFGVDESEAKVEECSGYDIHYTVQKVDDFESNYSAWIQIKSEEVHITYKQSPTLGDEAFFNYVQSIVQAK